MAKYTFELRELVSTFGRDKVKEWFMDYELSDFLTPEEIEVINARGTWSKEKLADRIIDHFFLREIGQDSTGAFILYAKNSMNELMETYAPLIYSASLRYDPLVNVNFSETFDRTTDSTTNTNSNSQSNGSGLTVQSDTPQGQINKADILQGKYASSTSANETEAQSTGNAEEIGQGNEHYEKKTVGNTGALTTSQALIKQYRDIIRALNTEIIYELEPLFMGIY